MDDEKIITLSDGIEPSEEVNKDINVTMNAYEMNKQIIANQKPMKKKEIAKARNEINTFFFDKKYIMLLCKDLSYYTMFVRQPDEALITLGDEVIGCAGDLGEIKAIYPAPDNIAFEIWVTNETGTYVAYLFDYEKGVILCK